MSAAAPKIMVTRAIVFTPLSLALWWFLLKGVSLWLLKVVAYVPLSLLIAPGGAEAIRTNPATGEWTFSVQLNTLAKNHQSGQMEPIVAVEFAVDEESVAFFACAWFSYAALAFSAVGFARDRIKAVLKGVGIQTGINVLALAAYVYINAYGGAINSPGETTPTLWLLKYFYHIIYLVVPFASPFAVALLVFPEWRHLFAAPNNRSIPSRSRSRLSSAIG